MDLLGSVQSESERLQGEQVFVKINTYEEFNHICSAAEEMLLRMDQKDSVVLCTQIRSFNRQKKTESTLNVLWVPYIASETVMAETSKFTSKGKTFVLASINDNKVSVEEAVQTFESMQCLSQVKSTFKATKTTATMPNHCCSYQAFSDALKLQASSQT